MKAYAEDSTNVSYVGQILALVDEENNTAEAYIIADSVGTLKPVGSGTMVDNKTIIVENDAIGLKDFEKRFYKYVPEVKDTDGTVLTEAGYELTEVSAENPWVAGLEPRVVLEDGSFVLGWFEPNPTTIEGVNNQVSALQTTVADLAKELGDPADGDKVATGVYAELDKKANAADVYTKTEVDEAIAAADHLQRKIVASYTAITTFINEYGAEEAAKYIFMVPESDTTADGNIYEEYMVIDGVIEVVGKWATDLTDYVTETELEEALKNYVDSEDLDNKLIGYVTTEALETKLDNYVDGESLNTVLEGFAQKTELDNYATKDDLSKKVDAVEGSRLITEEEAEKLNNLPESLIKSVDTTEFTIDTEGKLLLNKDSNSSFGKLNSTVETHTSSLESLIIRVEANESAIVTLNENIENINSSINDLNSKYTTARQDIDSLNTRVGKIETAVDENKTAIENLNSALENYVLKSTYDKDITELRDILTWKDIAQA